MNDKDKDRKDRKYFFDFGDVITTAHFMCRNCDTTVGAVPVEKFDQGQRITEMVMWKCPQCNESITDRPDEAKELFALLAEVKQVTEKLMSIARAVKERNARVRFEITRAE